MFELGLGIILAAWFVAAYFIYRNVFERERREPWAAPTINTPDTPQLAEKQPKFLTTSEMSAHHENEGRP